MKIIMLLIIFTTLCFLTGCGDKFSLLSGNYVAKKGEFEIHLKVYESLQTYKEDIYFKDSLISSHIEYIKVSRTKACFSYFKSFSEAGTGNSAVEFCAKAKDDKLVFFTEPEDMIVTEFVKID